MATKSNSKNKTPKTPKKILMNALGRAWMMWPARNEVKKRCKVEGKTGWYRCEKCNDEREKLEIDHITPCVKPSDGWVSWDHYIESRFVTADKLRGLCRDCHKSKTALENAQRI